MPQLAQAISGEILVAVLGEQWGFSPTFKIIPLSEGLKNNGTRFLRKPDFAE
jgi:hypothetical protein